MIAIESCLVLLGNYQEIHRPKYRVQFDFIGLAIDVGFPFEVDSWSEIRWSDLNECQAI